MSKRKTLLTTLAALAVVAAIVSHLRPNASPETVPTDPEVNKVAATTDTGDNSVEVEEAVTPLDASAEDVGLFESVNWRNRKPEQSQVYPLTYAELRALAEQGDFEAMRRLVWLLDHCIETALPLSDEELSAVVAEIRISYSVPKLSEGRFEFVPEATGDLARLFDTEKEFNSFVDQWAENTKLCTSITAEQRDEVGHWLSVLEAHGEEPDPAEEPAPVMSREERLAHIDRKWASGDPYAFAEYAEVYSDHELQLIDPTARVKEYAYISAFYEAMIEEAKLRSDTDGIATLRHSREIMLEHYRVQLSEYELKEAYEFARQAILANENCCIRISQRLFRY